MKGQMAGARHSGISEWVVTWPLMEALGRPHPAFGNRSRVGVGVDRPRPGLKAAGLTAAHSHNTKKESAQQEEVQPSPFYRLLLLVVGCKPSCFALQ